MDPDLNRGIKISGGVTIVAPWHPVVGMMNSERVRARKPLITARQLRCEFFHLDSAEVGRALAALPRERE